MKKIMKKKNYAELGGLLPKVCCDQGARQLGAGARGMALSAQAKARRGARHGAQGCRAQAGRATGALGRWARGRWSAGERSGGCAGRAAGAREARSWARGAHGWARGVSGARPAGRHGRTAWACCWAVGCALGALSLFFEPV